jgi:DNA-nicking Smr family endonuclease
LSFRRPHISEAVLTRLRRGTYVVGGEIDLHGMTGAEAKAALRTFIAECVGQRVRCARVVHGKGRRSGPRGPVLKNVVNHWLQHADDVLAFGSARAVDGGSGAIYVLLRSK